MHDCLPRICVHFVIHENLKAQCLCAVFIELLVMKIKMIKSCLPCLFDRHESDGMKIRHAQLVVAAKEDGKRKMCVLRRPSKALVSQLHIYI